MRGTATWWDILVDDLEVAQRFYGAEQVGQRYASSEPPSGRGIRMSFATDDLDGIVAKVASAGSTVKNERTLAARYRPNAGPLRTYLPDWKV